MKERAQYTRYTLKSEAILTGFAMSPRIARTLQRCENFTCARVFPTSISSLSNTQYIFFSLQPRANSAFNCARRADDIFLLLLCSRSRTRTFRFNKILRLPIDYRATVEDFRLRESTIRTQLKSNVVRESFRKHFKIRKLKRYIYPESKTPKIFNIKNNICVVIFQNV